MPTTFAQTINGDYIYAQRAVQDKNGDDIDQTYAKSVGLATVATSGNYSDLSGTPTIPSGSDLVPPYTLPTDEGKVLTVGSSTTYWATPSAGGITDVEVDGTSVVSQGVASITMPTVDQTYDGTSTNAQSGVAIAGELATINQVPASTSADSGKVLTVDSSGIPGWVTGGSGSTGLFEAVYGQTTYADVVQAIADKKIVYCRVSPSGASRMAFLAYIGSANVEFQYYRSVSSKSATNQGDEVYVYAVSNGNQWTTTTRNCYTRITAGTNMSQSYSSGVLTLSADAQLPAATSSDEGKVLTIDSNGDPEWATGGGGGTQADWTESDPTAASYIENKPTPKTLTAGTGISITENSSTITIANTAPDVPIGSWVDVSTEVQYNTTHILAGGFEIKYNSVLKLVSVTADVNLDAGAAYIFTWSNRLKPVANAFALGNGLTLYVSQTSLNQPAAATQRWVNGVWMWPVVGE